MDEEQKRKFEVEEYTDRIRNQWNEVEEWAERIRDRWNKVGGWSWEVILAWMLSKGFRLPEEQEPEPSPTEMVKRLLEKGWTIEQGDDTQLTEWYRLRDPEKPHFTHTFSVKQVTEAYRRAFPPKKRVEVEVWLNKDKLGLKYVSSLPPIDQESSTEIKGVATFWVEDK